MAVAPASAGRRAKLYSMLGVLAGSGLALLASTQTWYAVHLTAAANHVRAVAVQGSAAAPALTALALAGVALVAALAIAGPLIRIVLDVLGLVIGGSVLLSALTAVADPVQSAAPAITAASGVAGSASVAHLVAGVDASAWPWFAVAGGVLLVLAGLVALVTWRRWPGPSKRYQAVRFEPSEDHDSEQQRPSATPSGPAAGRDAAVDSWDELSRGDDPTR
jgi:uncharacterized membrane protein (TIGR02234 family)